MSSMEQLNLNNLNDNNIPKYNGSVAGRANPMENMCP
jgi:hypothetical protein